MSVQLSCVHRPPCPGCPRLGDLLATSPALEPLRELGAQHGVAVEVLERPARGYRMRSRLAVRGRVREPKIGLFEEGSHWVADIPECLVHHVAINRTADALRRAIQVSGTTPYTEATHRGYLRYVQIVVERSSQRVQVVLVGNCETPEPLAGLCDVLQRELGDRLQGLFFSAQTAKSNAILGPRCEKIAGADATVERIAGAQVFFPPDAFGQSHLALYDDVVQRIGSLVPDGSDVTELYAGVGAIGLSLVSRAARVRFNELGEGSLRGLQLGVDALPAELRARTSVYPGTVVDQLELTTAADVVIADPPRKGLAKALAQSLAASPPKRIIYLSCDTATFLRDTAVLLAGARLRLTSLTGCDFFPFTDHVETLAVFDRIA
jgi:23S rRNA (uracil1939-C5)-methyltransferase